MAVVIFYTLAVELATTWIPYPIPKWIGELGVVNAILLGVLLGFRNMQAYDRWWEARKLWGQLINDSRNLCLKSTVYAELDSNAKQTIGRLVSAFCLALRNHLHSPKSLSTLPGFETASVNPKHVPAYIASQCFELIRSWRKSNRITDIEFLALDQHVRAFMDICGACERIQKTPVPLSYRALLRHGTILYLITAPWFLTGEFGYWAIAVVGLLAYFLLGIEMTAEDVEEPFGRDGDDLELDKYCETIRISCEEILTLGGSATEKW